MKNLILGSLFAFLMGCANGSIVDETETVATAPFVSSYPLQQNYFCRDGFYINRTGFSDGQYQNILTTFERWNNFFGYPVLRENLETPDKLLEDHCTIRRENRPGELPSGFLGYYAGGGLLIISMNDFEDKFFQLIIMHELGHTFGFRDIEGEALMHSGFIGTYDFTELDRQECIAVGIC